MEWTGRVLDEQQQNGEFGLKKNGSLLSKVREIVHFKMMSAGVKKKTANELENKKFASEGEHTRDKKMSRK